MDKCFSGLHGNPSMGVSLEELIVGMEQNLTYRHLEVSLPLSVLRVCVARM